MWLIEVLWCFYVKIDEKWISIPNSLGFFGHHDSDEILNNNLGGGRLLAIAGDLSLLFFNKKNDVSSIL